MLQDNLALVLLLYIFLLLFDPHSVYQYHIHIFFLVVNLYESSNRPHIKIDGQSLQAHFTCFSSINE